jgi:hypothetical protein
MTSVGFLDICISIRAAVITKGAPNGAQNFHLSSDNITPDNLVCYNHLDFLCACFYFPNFPSTCTNFSQLCMLHPAQQNMWNSGYGYADGAHSSNSCGYYQHLTRWPANLSQPLHPNFIPSESGK